MNKYIFYTIRKMVEIDKSNVYIEMYVRIHFYLIFRGTLTNNVFSYLTEKCFPINDW